MEQCCWISPVKPEAVRHKEIGVKTNPTRNSLLNLTVYQTDIKDYQTQVQTPEPGVNRGYLANAEKVRVKELNWMETSTSDIFSD
jgi:iron complex outermembrane receptor protein